MFRFTIVNSKKSPIGGQSLDSLKSSNFAVQIVKGKNGTDKIHIQHCSSAGYSGFYSINKILKHAACLPAKKN